MEKELVHLIQRIRQRKENVKTLALRPVFFLNRYRHKGTRIMKEKWDNLILLNACRYDHFRKINHIQGKLEKRYSMGSHTLEWAKLNLREKHEQVVCITANRQMKKQNFRDWLDHDHPFHELKQLWNAHPQQINQKALELKQKHPGKKKIIHYGQPQHPFLDGPDLSRKQYEILDRPDWGKLFQQGISLEELEKGYLKNLEIVLEHIEKLIRKLEGRTIITADHGKALGEHGIYGDIPALYIKELRQVPWMQIRQEKKSRKEKSSGR